MNRPTLAAPSFQVRGVEQHGGKVAAGTPLRLAAGSGAVYYRLDGLDPRDAGGGIRPGSLVFDPATSPDLVLSGTTRVLARARDGSTWSALAEAESAQAALDG